MKKIIFGSLLIFVLSAWGNAAVLDQMSLQFSLRSHRGQPEWRWTPKVNFEVWGKYERFAKFTVQITGPAGNQLFKLDCQHTGDSLDAYATINSCGNELEAGASTNLTGVFSFKITQNDNNATLYNGKFTVGKYLYNPAKNPAFNKNFYYNIDYDWRLSTAYIGDWKDEYTPRQLFIWAWAKGNIDDYPKAYLYYNGKQIGEAAVGGDLIYSPEENESLTFSRLHFKFKAIFAKSERDNDDDFWKLYENPGEYEIKIMRKSEVSRTTKFTIGKDGFPAQNGIGKEVKNIYGGIIVPVQISGTADGAINQTMLKSGWWGNPISGITQ